ncbi:hypothetical protein PHMEG_00023492, partial [Phytophthora megakarya]
LLATTIVLFARNDNPTLASTKTTTIYFYADFYNVEDGFVTNRMHVLLGSVDDYKPSDIRHLTKSLTNQKE